MALITFVNLSGMQKAAKIAAFMIVFVFITILSMLIGLFSATEKGMPEGITGLSSKNFRSNWGSNYGKDVDFFLLTSIFFNACTGIMAGSNKSGDIADPSGSIPKGTMAAIATSFVIYATFIFLFGAVGNSEALMEIKKHIVAAEISWPWPWLVEIGIILSSSGAAL